MKWRNQTLALLCLVVFAALGVLYFKTWVVQKPFGVILFIGEGLTAQRVAAARVYSGGADARLALDRLPNSARVRNFSADFAVPDAAAAASMFATGERVKNGALAKNAAGNDLRSILDLAHERGKVSGLITDGDVAGPTLAAFYAHAINYKAATNVAEQLLSSGKVDLAFGGGASHFPALPDNGFHVARKKADLDLIGGWDGARVLALFAEHEFPFSDDIAARDSVPSLAEMVRRAIEILQANRRGYILVVDAHLMGAAAAGNLGERTLRETLELDAAIATAQEYGGTNSAIYVVGDVATGGMAINGNPLRSDSGVAILGLNSAGEPWVTWASGPNGGSHSNPATQEGAAVPEPAAIGAPTALPTLEDTFAGGSGLRSEKLRGALDATSIFALLDDAL